MLSSLVRPLVSVPVRQARFLATTAHTLPPISAQHSTAPALPYRVRRNSKGSIPVYTDIRNGGTRYLVLIRNVQGDVQALADDLARSLFPPTSSDAARLAIQTVHQKHVVISGGRWKNDVLRWLVQKGF